MNVKQMIVIRKDLKMRRGKEIAQGAHASMTWLSYRIQDAIEGNPVASYFNQEEEAWLFGPFTKICLRVDSEEELHEVHKKALEAGLLSYMCVDSGKTEFDGVPTPTCVAIGPNEAEKIDEITGDLKLY